MAATPGARTRINVDAQPVAHDNANLPDPDVLARVIMEELNATLELFAGIIGKLGERKSKKIGACRYYSHLTTALKLLNPCKSQFMNRGNYV